METQDQDSVDESEMWVVLHATFVREQGQVLDFSRFVPLDVNVEDFKLGLLVEGANGMALRAGLCGTAVMVREGGTTSDTKQDLAKK